jgi:hypothetical protein
MSHAHAHARAHVHSRTHIPLLQLQIGTNCVGFSHKILVIEVDLMVTM